MRASEPPAVAPGFLKLAGHPVRWGLLNELSRSDRRVGELCAALAVPQNLVSYHLSLLRGERVVWRRRSAADGRDSYYALDLGRCRQLLADVGVALHPGLRLVSDQARASVPRVRVLFLCTGNSARSQIAEALIEDQSGGRVEGCSAGSHPKALHANAVRAMRDRGIDLSGRRPKHLSEFSGTQFNYVISLCDKVREVCPEFPGRPNLIHWSIPDPAREGNSDEETLPAFDRTAEELAVRIAFLLELIQHNESTRGDLVRSRGRLPASDSA
jgi:protein-tyrosine-phosphatase/DNA-binding transcriptional ArsR family regulator